MLTKHQNSHTSTKTMYDILTSGAQHEDTNAIRYLLEPLRRHMSDGMWMKGQEQVKLSRSKWALANTVHKFEALLHKHTSYRRLSHVPRGFGHVPLCLEGQGKENSDSFTHVAAFSAAHTFLKEPSTIMAKIGAGTFDWCPRDVAQPRKRDRKRYGRRNHDLSF